MATGHYVRNPFEMFVEGVGTLFRDIEDAVRTQAREATPGRVNIRRIGAQDLGQALRRGLADLGASRADVAFIGLIYAVAGLLVARFALNENLLPLVFPLISGFALIGPIAAIGLYEISRRRERGEPATWASALAVMSSPAIGPILGVGALLLALFFAWLGVAWAIYAFTLGPQPPASLGAFVSDVFTTPAGWSMIAIGMGVGFLFAVAALAISVISFPLMLDRHVGPYQAIGASLRAVAANPGTMALWGLIVAGALVLGSIPALLGLIVVMPLLGHATWHLYRRVIEAA